MDISLVADSFYNLIGWKPTEEYNLDNTVTNSETMLYFNKAHPLISLENISAILRDPNLIEWKTYDGNNSYSVGSIVSNSGVLYRCIKEIIISGGSQPPPITDTEYWIKHDHLSYYISTVTRRAIESVVIDWMQGLGEEKMIHSGKIINEYAHKVSSNNGLYCGIRLSTKNSKSLGINTRKIYLHFEVAQEIPIKVYKKGTLSPINELFLNYTDAGSVQEFDFNYNWESGDYYIGYDMTSITGGYYGVDTTNSNRAFSQRGFTCSNGFSFENNHSYSNYGIDIDLDVQCDFTKIIIEQRNKFISAIKNRVVIEWLREFIYNPSSVVNRNESNMDDAQLQFEIDGSKEIKNTKLGEKYAKSLKGIAVDFTKLDKVCHSCKRRGIKYSTV